MNNYNIHFDEMYYSPENEEMTIYFMADAAVILELYPDTYVDDNVVGTEISVAFPRTLADKDLVATLDEFVGAAIEVSPTADMDGCMTDYDWREIDFIDSTIEQLYKIYKEEI